MKYLYLVVTEFLYFLNSGANNPIFFPNLPAGEYLVYFKAIFSCFTSSNPDLQFDWRLSKTSRIMTELRGNFTINAPFDDSFMIFGNFTVKDSIGGWKDNAFNYKSPKGCTTLKRLLGPTWVSILNNLGFDNTNCPLKKGIYSLKNGFDLTTAIANSSFPKIFFYGTYKFSLSFNDKFDKQRGCLGFVVDVKRPWETI